MLRVQIADGAISSPGQYPTRGYRLPEFTLISASILPITVVGVTLLRCVRVEQNRHAGCWRRLGHHYPQLREEEAQVLAVIQGFRHEAAEVAEKLALPFRPFVDEDGRVHRQLGATDSEGRSAPALYDTDRYSEVFAAYRSSAGQGLPRAGEVLNWLACINSQCPECEPPE